MEINKAVPNLPTVSASKIKVFKTCARQYTYKYMLPYDDRPADDKNVAALLGTALHKAIETKYRENKAPTFVFQEVMENTITEWEKQKYKINAAGYYTTAMKVGKDILKSFDWNKFNPLELEFEFTLPFPNADHPIANVNGYIDLIDMSGMVVDHKSASKAPIQDELDHDPQFILYAWAYEQIYGSKPWKVIWNHLRTATLIEANIHHSYDDKLEQLELDMRMMLHSQTPGVRRQMDDVCRTKCSFYSLCYGTKAAALSAEESE